jgi:hypothetical protein
MIGIVYTKLRHACLSEGLREDFPEWPFPLLFQGHEITRDIFYLDPLIEWREIELGRNPVRDASFLRYRSLNQWFHYRFFNGLAPVVNSAEANTLLPRLFRLRRVLLESLPGQSLAAFFEREFSISHPDELVNTLVNAVARIMDICSEHKLVVWGIRLNERAHEEHIRYTRDIVSMIRTDLVLDLPHLRPLKLEWDKVLRNERKEFRKAEARYNKRRKNEKRFQQNDSANGGQPFRSK